MLEKIQKLLTKVSSGLNAEASVLEELSAECRAAVDRMDAIRPGFKAFLGKAYAYAVFPSVGKAAVVLGGAFGKGEVFERGKLIGYAAVAQLTIGVQLGGDTFVEVVVFESKQALERFKQGRTAFAASASGVLIKATASAAADFEKGAAVFVHGEGGMMLEAAIGGQHFAFRPAVMGRARLAPTALKKSSASKARPARRAAKVSRPAKSSRRRAKPPRRPTVASKKPRARHRAR
jgi:lipid-binding SYLF domain-containing protein